MRNVLGTDILYCFIPLGINRCTGYVIFVQVWENAMGDSLSRHSAALKGEPLFIKLKYLVLILKTNPYLSALLPNL